MADSKKYDGGQWEHSLRKLTTATEAVENPLYSDGTTITAYALKGNEEHTGTPSPSNPVDVVGVGKKSENVLKITSPASATGVTAIITDDGNGVTINGTAEGATRLPTLSTVYFETGTYTITGCPKDSGISIDIREANSSVQIPQSSDTGNGAVFTIDTADNYRVCARVPQGTTVNNLTIYPMITEGTTIPESYEPYGYKIPISSGGVTTNIYLGSTQTVRAIKKYTFTGNETVFNCVPTIDRQNYCVAFRYSDIGWTDIKDIEEDMAGIDYPVFISSHFSEKESTHEEFTDIQSGEMGANSLTGKNRYIIFCVAGLTTASDYSAWFAQQYANGTPVEVYYILETATTAAVNEPLMKIGDYDDTLSNAASIPTAEGANSISVDTTVQPSEFMATWTGWHDAEVKEYDGSDWQ